MVSAYEALDGGEVGGRLQDRLARAVAAAAAAVGLVVERGLGARERLEVAQRGGIGEESSTIVRY